MIINFLIIIQEKMRIGIDAHMLGDHSGGNESFYSNILANFKKSTNDDYFLFVYEGIDTQKFQNVFEIINLKEKSAFKRNFFELPRLCKKYKLDLLHTQYFIPFKKSCKYFCTIHDICFEHFKNIFTKKEYFIQKTLIPYAARKSELIFTVSEHAKKDICSTYNIENKKVEVVYNAVNGEFRKLKKNDLDEKKTREKYGIGENKYVLSVGNLQPRKNIPALIRAFNMYKQKNNCDCKLVIVGKKAWMYNEIISSAINNSNDIIFTDYVEQNDLIRIYNMATCFVYPSIYEGFGIPPLEAMACGVPVAVAKTSALPEVVGNAGLYFDPYDEVEIADSIKTLMEDNLKREELINKSQEQLEKFSWSESANKLQLAYKKVLDR